jgi:hypothetical protein
MATTPPPDVVAIRDQVYKDPRPKEHFDQFHARTRKGEPEWVYEGVRVFTSLYSWTFFRARGHDAVKVPSSGPVILAPNHFSFMDHFFVGAFTRRRVSFMAKSQLFTRPLQWIYTYILRLLPGRIRTTSEAPMLSRSVTISSTSPLTSMLPDRRLTTYLPFTIT